MGLKSRVEDIWGAKFHNVGNPGYQNGYVLAFHRDTGAME